MVSQGNWWHPVADRMTCSDSSKIFELAHDGTSKGPHTRPRCECTKKRVDYRTMFVEARRTYYETLAGHAGLDICGLAVEKSRPKSITSLYYYCLSCFHWVLNDDCMLVLKQALPSNLYGYTAPTESDKLYIKLCFRAA